MANHNFVGHASAGSRTPALSAYISRTFETSSFCTDAQQSAPFREADRCQNQNRYVATPATILKWLSNSLRASAGGATVPLLLAVIVPIGTALVQDTRFLMVMRQPVEDGRPCNHLASN
jgi:hypothetical protein